MANTTAPDLSLSLQGALTLIFNEVASMEPFRLESLITRASVSDAKASRLAQRSVNATKTISRAAVSVSVTHDDNTTTVAIEIRFRGGAPALLIPAPQNMGPLPLMRLDVSSVQGLIHHEVIVVQTGSAPINQTFHEQRIELNCRCDIPSTSPTPKYRLNSSKLPLTSL